MRYISNHLHHLDHCNHPTNLNNKVKKTHLQKHQRNPRTRSFWRSHVSRSCNPAIRSGALHHTDNRRTLGQTFTHAFLGSRPVIANTIALRAKKKCGNLLRRAFETTFDGFKLYIILQILHFRKDFSLYKNFLWKKTNNRSKSKRFCFHYLPIKLWL